MLGDSGISERSALSNNYLQIVGHISPEVVLLETGGVMAVGRMAGCPYELADPSDRNGRFRLLNTIYRNIADNNVTLHTHLVRYCDDRAGLDGTFCSDFAQALHTTYHERVLQDRIFRNDYYITLVVQPRHALGSWAGQKLARFGKKFPEAQEKLIRELEDQWLILASGLEKFGLHRLSTYEKDNVVFTEIGEALRLVIDLAPNVSPLISSIRF